MKIIDNILTSRHPGQIPELENRLKEVRKHLIKIPNLVISKGKEFLHLGHSLKYIESIKNASKKTGFFYEVNFSPETYEVATAGVGASILGAENEAFVLTRPPGHHAGYNLPDEKIGLGYCVFNNMAIASKYLRNKGKKVFVLDIDLHYGNGTQDILKNEEGIYVFDISREGGWPWQENFYENCFNLKLKNGTKDEGYINALEQVLIPKLKEFQPDIIGISAGFDTSKKNVDYLKNLNDPDSGNQFELTQESYKKVKEIVREYPHFAILEGGYSPQSISEGVRIFTEN